MRRLVGFLLALVLSLPMIVAASETSDRLKAVSWQLFVKEWGKLTAICSAGAYWTDGTVTRLLTAGHCIALVQLDLGKSAQFLVTQSGSDFRAARVLASGWRVREIGTVSDGSKSAQRNFAVLPHPGFVAPLYVSDRISIDRGDWAILEIDGRWPIAPLGDSTELAEDDFVFAFGYPLGGDRFFSRGYVASVNYQAPSTEWPEGYIAADITAAPGNSGSLIVNVRGEAVAVLVAGAGDRIHILTPIALIQKQVGCLAEVGCSYFKKP